MPTLLNRVLAWQNSTVPEYFCHQHPDCTPAEARQLFQDLLAWMCLTLHRKKNGKHTWLFGPLLALDQLWHAFILHTRLYSEFCQQFFGQYFHHDIEAIGEEYQQTPDELADFLQDCFDYLGDAWVERYFGEALA